MLQRSLLHRLQYQPALHQRSGFHPGLLLHSFLFLPLQSLPFTFLVPERVQQSYNFFVTHYLGTDNHQICPSTKNVKVRGNYRYGIIFPVKFITEEYVNTVNCIQIDEFVQLIRFHIIIQKLQGARVLVDLMDQMIETRAAADKLLSVDSVRNAINDIRLKNIKGIC